MLEYKLNKNEGKMLHSLLGKVLNHFELTLKQFGLYADTLCIYDMLDTNNFEKLEFDNRDDVVSCMTSLNFCISYTDFVEIENLVEVDELISRMLIDLYEKI